MTRKRAIFYLVITAILWSMGGLFIKLVDWNPIAIAGSRSGISALVMLFYLKKPIRNFNRNKLIGGFLYALLMLLFVSANKLTTSANAILLQFTAPIWVALFCGWFLKEKTRIHDWFAVAAVMFGMTLFFVGDLGSGNMFGNFVAVLSGVAMAGVAIYLKLQSEGSPVEMTMLGNILTFLVAIPFLFYVTPTLGSITGILILGVFQLGISYILYSLAVQHVSALEAILIPIIEPLLNPIWVFLFTGESPGPYAVWGGAIVIGSVVIRSLCQHRSERGQISANQINV